MKVLLEPGAFMPTRAFKTDAGLDLYAMHNEQIPPHKGVRVLTGVHIELPPGTAGLLVSRSGLNLNESITSTGLIDPGYNGAIVVKLYNHGDRTYFVRKGDRISQLLIVPFVYEDVELVNVLEGGERGQNGFGSSGR